jgi:hypothetical protein
LLPCLLAAGPAAVPVTTCEPGRPCRLDWADSEVLAMRPAGTQVDIVFAAATVELACAASPALGGDAAPQRPLRGHVRHLVASLSGAGAVALRDCVGRIRSAHVSRGGTRLSQIDVPCRLSGDLAIDIEFANGASYRSRVEAIDFHFRGEAGFTESLAC